MPFGGKPAPEERRRERKEFFEMMLKDYIESQEMGTWLLMAEFLYDPEKKLFTTTNGMPVLSPHFIDPDLLFGEGKVPKGFY